MRGFFLFFLLAFVLLAIENMRDPGCSVGFFFSFSLHKKEISGTNKKKKIVLHCLPEFESLLAAVGIRIKDFFFSIFYSF